MRITGGEFGGRKVRVPAGNRVRPTQDRVRGALFSMLAARIPGARVLDLFAGSGAVGLDALSRGAGAVVWVEADRRNADILRENLRSVAGCATQVVCADCVQWLRKASTAPFDLVFADPPYDWAEEHGFSGIAERLQKRRLVCPDGFFVTEQPARMRAETLIGWESLRDRTYGQTRLVVYRPTGLGATAARAENGEEQSGGAPQNPSAGATEP
jgi:16S rRNA (guanine966-N2)-methyltransferase